ncbi:YtxH domain-containing protein [Confluentibacter flavum]|uniref:YtxH domain-containing protein n=1 Tax=Confluentibacter flavum TaxID=1909700 RepID=A0A2N3HMM7_9FLAO|nr:YtxH domain-containing protein [Confluentibacter flavum]PKQ46098.1 YtxH domain-containing protein [Confluentibacter flavum]
MKTSNTILGLLAGVAVGATLGVLFAPDKGEATRRKISEKSKQAKDKVKEGFNDFLDTVSDKYSSLKENGEEFLNKEKETIKDNMKKTY